MVLEFRTISTYDHEKHSDFEVFTQPSLTDPSEYESLESLLARCLRGDYSKMTGVSGGFDENASDEEIINAMEPQERESFDISDKTEFDHLITRVVKEEKEKKGAKAPETGMPEKSKIEEPNSQPKADEEAPKA